MSVGALVKRKTFVLPFSKGERRGNCRCCSGYRGGKCERKNKVRTVAEEGATVDPKGVREGQEGSSGTSWGGTLKGLDGELEQTSK